MNVFELLLLWLRTALVSLILYAERMHLLMLVLVSR
jgi:hypothetical protein